MQGAKIVYKAMNGQIMDLWLFIMHDQFLGWLMLCQPNTQLAIRSLARRIWSQILSLSRESRESSPFDNQAYLKLRTDAKEHLTNFSAFRHSTTPFYILFSTRIPKPYDSCKLLIPKFNYIYRSEQMIRTYESSCFRNYTQNDQIGMNYRACTSLKILRQIRRTNTATLLAMAIVHFCRVHYSSDIIHFNQPQLVSRNSRHLLR